MERNTRQKAKGMRLLFAVMLQVLLHVNKLHILAFFSLMFALINLHGLLGFFPFAFSRRFLYLLHSGNNIYVFLHLFDCHSIYLLSQKHVVDDHPVPIDIRYEINFHQLRQKEQKQITRELDNRYLVNKIS